MPASRMPHGTARLLPISEAQLCHLHLESSLCHEHSNHPDACLCLACREMHASKPVPFLVETDGSFRDEDLHGSLVRLDSAALSEVGLGDTASQLQDT